MTYLLMSLPFVGVSLVIFALGAVHARRRGIVRRYVSSWAVATAALVALTAIFDNVMMAAGFFDYGLEQISGLRLGLMPVEDFLYPVAGALLLCGLWQLFDRRASIEEASDG